MGRFGAGAFESERICVCAVKERASIFTRKFRRTRSAHSESLPCGIARDPGRSRFLPAAYQRIDDAQLLFNGGRTTSAVYLGGYAVECILKSLLISSVLRRDRARILGLFHGRLAHDFDWLTMQYVKRSKAVLPRDVSRYLTRVRSWSTDLRYNPATIRRDDARLFLDAVKSILHWVEGKL